MKMNMKLFTKLICILCMMTMMVSVVACGNNSGNSESTQDGTQTESQKDIESETQENSETESQTETGTETETESNEDTQTGTYVDTEDSTENKDTTTGSTNSEQDNTTNNNTTDNNTTNSEEDILGEGSASQPYMETPVVEGDVMTMTTVSIKAGKSVHYDIYRVGGMILTIHDASAYVVYNGTKYEAQNGKVTFQVENALASDAIQFEIGNKGANAASYKIQFSNPTGSYMNPTPVSSLSNPFNLHVDAGNEVGHYYKYVAEKTGTITFYVSKLTSSTKNAKAFISVTNNNTYANRTTDADGTTDGGYVKISLEVTSGDEIMIEVGASPTSTWKYPAEDITWVAEYQ